MALAPARVSIPEEAKKGEIIEIKALIRHPMETGYRVDNVGNQIPRNIITTFTATYAGEEIFRMDLNPGVSANPFIAFHTVATETGELTFNWTDDSGEIVTVRKTLKVVA